MSKAETVTTETFLIVLKHRLLFTGYHPQKVLKSGDFSAIVLVYSEVDKKHTVLKMLHPRHEHVEASGWTSPQDQLKCKDRMQQVCVTYCYNNAWHL